MAYKMKGFSGFGNSPMKKRRKATYTTDPKTGETTKTKYYKSGEVKKTKTYAEGSARPTTKTKYSPAGKMYKKVERTPGGKLGSAKVTKAKSDRIRIAGREQVKKTTRGKQIKNTIGKLAAAGITGAILGTPAGATVAGTAGLGMGAIGVGSALIDQARGLAQNVKDVTKGVKRKISTGKYKTEDDYRSKTYGLERKLEKAESKGKVRKTKRLKKRITKREARTQSI